MAEKVANRQLGGRVWVMKLEGRIEIADARPPIDQAFADERSNDCRGYWFRQRRELEHRVGIDQVGLADLSYAKALQVDRLVLVHDRDGDAGHSLALDRLAGQVFQLPQGGSNPLVRHRLTVRGERHHADQQSQDCGEAASPPITGSS